MKYEIWDVFTSTKFAGNPLAVVRDAAHLSTAQMQKIAAEFNLSETSFILSPEQKDHMARVRIFTPGYELPFAGHPTIGTALSIAGAQGRHGGFTLGLAAGPVAITFSTAQDGLRAQFTAPGIPRRVDGRIDLEAAARALSLPIDKIDVTDAAPALCGIEGVRFLYVKTDKPSVQTASLTLSDYGPLGLASDIVGLYVYADDDTQDNGIYARMFAPEAGMIEDPATGSAAVGLAAHLPGKPVNSEGHGADTWYIRQGVDMGRPSLIELGRIFDPAPDDDRPKAVTIAGSAVEVMRGEFL